MSNVTTLSDGRVGHDQLRVELVEAGNRPPHVRIIWPPHATVTTVAHARQQGRPGPRPNTRPWDHLFGLNALTEQLGAALG